MRKIYGWATTILGVLSFAGVATAQFPGGGPHMRGVWNPVVGSGGVYEMSAKDANKSELQIAIVGKEWAEGKQGYWLEMAMQSSREGKVVMKQLIVLDGDNTHTARMIMQIPNQPPMEMPTQMMQQRGHTDEKADIRKYAELVGSETITTPAGTFDCEHYRNKKDSSDVWVSTKVSPWGFVKMTSPDSSMTLIKVLTDAKSQITGTPVNPMQMQRPQ